MKKVLIVSALALGVISLSGCNWFSSGGLAPIVGQELLNIGGAVIAAECSPQLAADGTIISNVINIIAPNSATATTAATVLSTNQAVAAQLCPLVVSITAAVGTLPTGSVVATVPATTSTTPSAGKPLPITYLWLK